MIVRILLLFILLSSVLAKGDDWTVSLPHPESGTINWIISANSKEFLPCSVTRKSKDGIEYKWKKDGEEVQDQKTSLNGSVLVFTGFLITVNDSGTYTCEITLFGETKNASVNVSVIESPKSTNSKDSIQSPLLYKSAFIKCPLSLENIWWTQQASDMCIKIINGTDKYSLLSNGSILSINNFTSANDQEFYCHGELLGKQFNEKVVVSGGTVPSFSSYGTTITKIIYDESYKFNCKSEGNPTPREELYKVRINSSDTPILDTHFSPSFVHRGDDLYGYEYFCKTSNIHGEATSGKFIFEQVHRPKVKFIGCGNSTTSSTNCTVILPTNEEEWPDKYVVATKWGATRNYEITPTEIINNKAIFVIGNLSAYYEYHILITSYKNGISSDDNHHVVITSPGVRDKHYSTILGVTCSLRLNCNLYWEKGEPYMEAMNYTVKVFSIESESECSSEQVKTLVYESPVTEEVVPLTNLTINSYYELSFKTDMDNELHKRYNNEPKLYYFNTNSKFL